MRRTLLLCMLVLGLMMVWEISPTNTSVQMPLAKATQQQMVITPTPPMLIMLVANNLGTSNLVAATLIKNTQPSSIFNQSANTPVAWRSTTNDGWIFATTSAVDSNARTNTALAPRGSTRCRAVLVQNFPNPFNREAEAIAYILWRRSLMPGLVDAGRYNLAPRPITSNYVANAPDTRAQRSLNVMKIAA